MNQMKTGLHAKLAPPGSTMFVWASRLIPALLDSLHYWCEQCKPENHKELLDGIAQGRKPWEERRRAYEQAELEAQKAKKAKKGKAKRASDQVAEVVQNGKVTQVEPPADVKKEKEKEKKGSSWTGWKHEA